MVKTIALAGTMDSKGKEFLFVKELIESLGFNTLIIHTGVFEPSIPIDVSNSDIASAVGANITDLAENKDRARATEVLSQGMEKILPELYEAGKFDGILSLGGTGGTSMVTPGMRALPVGVPKVMVSTVASGNTEPYVGTSDIVMVPSIVDVAGLNVISTKVFSNAVFAITGMLSHESKTPEDRKPLIAATMFGLTTPCINHAKAYLEEKGYEVLVFHATGVGGQTMESLIEEGFFDGVLDMTTTELADELVGGVLTAGPHRLEAAGTHGVPQVISPGAMDMINFGPYESVPEQFSKRNFYKHNPTVTLMRTTQEENAELGRILAEKLNQARGNTSFFIPLQGFSGLSKKGQAFHSPENDAALISALKQNIDQDKVTMHEMATDINDKAFAEAAAEELVTLIERNKGAK
ncbi:Adenosylhomocysteinase [Lentibacillus sp. JNUCC-1]|uniref:Tm-1-like ATP-binding domain-containing protein n=1 Tax=Lentibacillus sp. JNUCC-1 TaxID=2654513 RepID=UPI0012E8E29E|nr:Tm-1-like ATP-binding domain-containing protein [Lentibacillus sp. JNUCC-1]MUV36930.1 Adenosylhomocysteinase [Lentibacillus sp. JNUCC-1]